MSTTRERQGEVAGGDASVPERAAPLPAEHPIAPPVGEEIHLPGPTVLPFVTAIGITMVVIGTTINWLISIGGGIVLIITIAMWIRDTRRDVAALPEEHH
jgi:hypothetical protein